jgi:O-succinylbenzoate synthase
MGACQIVNIKMGRVGGLQEAIAVHNTCQELGIPVWCGGMLETGIGRAHNIALSTLENFSIPGDVSAARRYFQRDTVVPSIEVSEDGYMVPPSAPGIGYEPDLEWIERITLRKQLVS